MNRSELIAFIAKAHKPELAKVEGGHVYQVWNDGELTLTKAGSLLGSRTLHMIMPGNPDNALSWHEMPVKHPNVSRKLGFAYVTREDGETIAHAIREGLYQG